MALAGALCAVVHTITGFTNRSLRAQVSTLLGTAYTTGQMSYDLTANDPPAPLPLRQALRVIDRHVDDYITEARMAA
ncbi:MAG: hypothetical protein ACRDSL_13770 [Pseudonocardiaceae bacterium]